jgi:hypothetical protein
MMAALLGKIWTTLVRLLKLSCQGRVLSGVAEHRSADHVGQVALEDAHGFAPRVPVRSSVVIDLAGARFALKLRCRDAMNGGVESPVPALSLTL